MSKLISRRGVLLSTAGLAGTLAMPTIRTSWAQDNKFAGKTLKILTWSDPTGTALLNHIAKTFEEKTGAKVVADRTGGTGDMVAKLKALGDKPQYDVMMMAGVGAVTLADAKLLEKPDLNKLPNLKDVDPRFQTGADGFGIGYLLWTGGLIYNTKTFKEAPKSYAEMWEASHKKRLFLPPSNWTDALDTIVAAAIMTGGNAANAESGFKKLAELKDSVLTFGENPTQIAELFKSNALDIGGVYAPAFYSEELMKPEFNMGATYDLKEGFFADLMYTVMPKAHPGDSDMIHAFINHSLDPVVQGKMAEAVLNGPVNGKAVMSEAAKKSPMIIKPEQMGDKAIIHDKALIAKVRTDWIKRYTQTFS